MTLSINKSRISYTMTEYFIDEEKYGYLKMIHEYTTYIIGGFAIMGTGTMFIACLQHVCGLFTIAR